MKIVILDGHALNPGDLSWEGFKQLGECDIYEYTPAEKTVERCQDVEVLITNKTVLDKTVLSALPSVKYIGLLSTGTNVVDLGLTQSRGIVVTNIPDYSTYSVAQMVFAHIFAFTQRVKEHSDSVRDGQWSRNRDFCFWNYPLIELAGKTIGIVGFGRIGQQVADIAMALGMKTLAFSRHQTGQSHRRNFKWAELDELLAESDFVSLHCPLYPATQGMINRNSLAKMKRSAFLINTARGGLIVEDDLAQALNTGVIAGAGLDVLTVEPPQADNPLLTAQNCTITPHIAWATIEARTRLMDIAVNNLRAYMAGQSVNVVNPL